MTGTQRRLSADNNLVTTNTQTNTTNTEKAVGALPAAALFIHSIEKTMPETNITNGTETKTAHSALYSHVWPWSTCLPVKVRRCSSLSWNFALTFSPALLVKVALRGGGLTGRTGRDIQVSPCPSLVHDVLQSASHRRLPSLSVWQ